MDKLWHGRLSKGIKQEVEAFTASIFFDYPLAEFDILGSLAHVKMLHQVGLLTSSEASEIQRGLLQVREKFSQNLLQFSAADEDIHTKIEKELRALIGPLAGKMHIARSRNDQVALDMHLFLRSKTLTLIELIKHLQQALGSMAKTHLDVIMPGYTHLQQAQPILFSHHLLAYASMLQRDIHRLMQGWPSINQLPLGTCALAGTGLPIDRQYVAELLKFDSLYENSIDAVSDRDFCVEFLSAAAMIMMHLSRLSEELIIWSSQEFAFIELDDAYCTGSSIMPQKKNPDVPELVRGKTGRVYGSLHSLLTILKGLPLAYNKDMQEDKEAVFDAVKTLETSLSLFKGLIETMQINADTMLQAAKKGFLNATELADYLALKGMPFREAHALTGKIVRHCVEKDQRLEDLTLEEFQSFSQLISEDIKSKLDLKRIVDTRNSRGGTSSTQVKRQLALLADAFKATEGWLADKQKKLANLCASTHLPTPMKEGSLSM